MLDGRRLRALDESQPDALEHLGCGSRWAVCQTHPSAERWALANLQRQGYPAYLPLHRVTRRDPVTRSMTRKVEVPLFAGYCFVVPGTHWSPIAHSRGVSKLLMNGDHPYLCPCGVLEAVRATEAARRTPTTRETLHRPGAVCSVAYGALQGHQGVVVSLTRTHAVLALMLLSALRRVTLPLDCLAPAT